MSRSISAQQFKKLLESGKEIVLIDVRTPVEFREIHVEGARNEPLDRLDPVAIKSAYGDRRDEELYVICRSGARGQKACEKLLAAGITNVVNVEGGTMACVAAGATAVRGKKSIPLNCQVQIIVGSLVIAGSLLAYYQHPLWIGVPLVMGVGLLFSGLTNTCAMGMILARMPWNDCKDGSCPK